MGKGRVSGKFARTLNLIPFCCLTTGTPTLMHCLLKARASCSRGLSPQGPGLSCFLLWSRPGKLPFGHMDNRLLPGEEGGEGPREPALDAADPPPPILSKFPHTNSHLDCPGHQVVG